MCIVIISTSHPSYAFIAIDNRDEFILRPTTRPHWWRSTETTGANGVDGPEILSARDLQRPEKGTWMGISRGGNFAVLTNYREAENHAPGSVHGLKSRGVLSTAWLNSPHQQSTQEFVHGILETGVKGVGGFSLICGKLRKRSPKTPSEHPTIQPLAIISNRADHSEQIPWVAGTRNEVLALSNTCFTGTCATHAAEALREGPPDPEGWPKVKSGEYLTTKAVEEAVRDHLGEDELIEKLFGVLSVDTLPRSDDFGFSEYVASLKQSIFIPAIGDQAAKIAMQEAISKAEAQQVSDAAESAYSTRKQAEEHVVGAEQGMYGTQRQTVVLVDWDGNVSFTERALYDDKGIPVPKGSGDVSFKFRIDGWEDGDE